MDRTVRGVKNLSDRRVRVCSLLISETAVGLLFTDTKEVKCEVRAATKQNTTGEGLMSKFYALLSAATLLCAVTYGQQAPDTNMQSSPQAGQSQAASPSANSASTRISEKDRQFIEKAARCGSFEIKSAETAKQQATNPEVKEFATKLIEDHQKAADELKSIASRLNVSLPASVDENQQQELKKQQDLRGAEFDKAFTKAHKKAHEEAVALFKNAAESSENPDIKAWAQKNLPVLEGHLNKAKTLAERAG
jgi:putative membrane protein